MMWQKIYLKFHPKILVHEEKDSDVGWKWDFQFRVSCSILFTGLWYWLWRAPVTSRLGRGGSVKHLRGSWVLQKLRSTRLLVWASPCVYSVRAFSVQVDLSVISSALNFGLQCTAKSEMKGKILVLPKFTEDCVSSCCTSVFTGFSAGKY